MRDILIIEDGFHERDRLTRLFSSAGYSVRNAESAHEAERLLALEHFRLSILDIGLGDKSGSTLFEMMRREKRVAYIVVLTGNASVHLKQKFLDEGASAYIVKASPAAENESLLDLVNSLLGTAHSSDVQGIALADFLRLYIDATSRELFLDADGSIAPCAHCGTREFIVTFSHKTQLPPLVEGRVVCQQCGLELDPEVG